MASKGIKGITVEIGGDATGLDKALKGVDNTSVKLNSELKEVNKLLKFDPSSATGLAQKQELLTKSIENTSTKLNQLKSAQSEVDAQFKSGKIGEEQYRAFQREISTTGQSLKSYKTQLNGLQAEQAKLGQNTDRLNTYFKASGKSIDDFADVLGSRLVNSIKNGTATSDQLEIALNKIGKGALGADVDISKFKTTLDSVKSGNSLDNVKTELSKIAPEADKAEKSIDELGNSVKSGNLMKAGEVVAGVGDKIKDLADSAKDAALEFGGAFGKIAANTNLSKAEMEKLKGVAKDVFKSGVTDSIDEATNATVLMKGAFKDLNDADLTKLTSSVISLSERTGTDVSENVKGTSQLMKQFGLDSTQAFDLVASGYKNGLNYSGDFMDTLNEYAPLFSTTGYSAQEMLSILQNGMEAGSMNTDKTADAVKELQIRLGDGSMDKAIASFSDNSKEVFGKWKEGKATVKDVASSIQEDLKKMSPQDQQAALSTLSTQFEDLGIKGALSLFDVKTGYDNVAGAMAGASEKDPSQEWQASLNELKTVLQEVGVEVLKALKPLIEFIVDLAKKFNGLSEPVKQFILIFGGILAVLAILAPIIAAVMAVGATVGFIAVLIGAAIALIIAIVMNWGKIVEWLKGVWGGLSTWFSNLWQGIKDTISNVWQGISDFFVGMWQGIVNTAAAIFTPIIQVFQVIFMTIQAVIEGIWLVITSILKAAWDIIVALASFIFTPIIELFAGIWNAISGVITTVWNFIAGFLGGIWNAISGVAMTVFSAIAGFFSGIWNAISGVITSVWSGIVGFLSGIWNTISGVATGVFSAIASFLSGIWNGISSVISSVWGAITGTISSVINGISNIISNVFNAIKGTAVSIWNGIKNAIVSPIEEAKNTISNIIDAIKGFFSGLSFKLPKFDMPPMPHFSIQGKFSLSPPSVPSLGVDWYAKGGILTKPTIFGMNGNTPMGGGEAGKEAVAPLSDLMAYVQTAVKAEIGGMDANFSQMIQLLTVIASKDLNFNMDGKAITEIVDGHMNTQQQQSQFGLGRI